MKNRTFYVVAFKSEIQDVITNNNLDFKEHLKFKIFENENIIIILSGKGAIKSAIATTYLAQIYKIQDTDTIINFGTCASKTKKIGEKIEFGKVVDISTNKKFVFDKTKEKIFCSPTEIFHKNHKYEFVDMESNGFYLSAKLFFKNIKIIKIVSDNFENVLL